MRQPKHQPIPDGTEAERLLRAWSKNSAVEAAILAGTFVEDRLGFAIKSFFVKMPSRGNPERYLTENALFDGYGPLATFFAKIDLGFALGIYDVDQRMDFHIIRSIRNEFAHALEPITFENESIVRKLSKLHCMQKGGYLAEQIRTSRIRSKKFVYILACCDLSGFLKGYVEGKEEGKP